MPDKEIYSFGLSMRGRTTLHQPSGSARAAFIVILLLMACSSLLAQDRDLRAERIIVDDDGADGTINIMRIEAPNPLGQDVVLTIPDLGADSLQFLLVPPGTPGAWLLSGNAGTTAGTNFLGTTDATALHIYVNGGSSNSLILNTNGSMQRGAGGDGRGGSAVDLQIDRNGASQVASGTYSTIGGGRRNSAINIAATVAGGDQNRAQGRYTTVGGGTGNVASSSDGLVTAAITVAGGQQNQATGVGSTIGGGAHNMASGSDAVIAGGSNNSISGQTNAILGGVYNAVTGYRSAVGGGDRNLVDGRWSMIPGGRGLTLTGDGSFGFLGGNHNGTVVSRGNNLMTLTENDIAVLGNVDLLLANNDGTASRLRFYEANATVDSFPTATTFYTSFEAGDQTADINYTLPTAAPTADGQVLSSTTGGAMSWTSDPALNSVQANVSSPVNNSRLMINEGHWTTQGTAPTAAGDGTNLAAGVSLNAASTDVAGILTATDGGGVGTGVITVTFDASYASTPVIMVMAANATAANSSFFVSNVSTTSFDLNVSTTTGNGTDTYVFNYMVVEAD